LKQGARGFRRTPYPVSSYGKSFALFPGMGGFNGGV
jgi:hypothetical protein